MALTAFTSRLGRGQGRLATSKATGGDYAFVLGDAEPGLVVDDLLNGTNNSKTARDAFVPLQVVEAARRSFESGRIERVLGI